MLRVLREPLWLIGVASMILGFACQAVALHYGSLALVQPILASEMLFVFTFVALLSPRQVRAGDLLAALAMAVGLGAFLFTADPHGGRAHAPAGQWALSGLAGALIVTFLTRAALARHGSGGLPSPGRRAALLGAATGVSWGYLAAVIKELGSHTGGGLGSLLSNWSPYVLVLVGVGSMILSANALRAGPLAASQPGFTIVDPLVAGMLGVWVFGDRLDTAPGAMTLELVAVAAVVWGVVTLSRSSLVRSSESPAPAAPR